MDIHIYLGIMLLYREITMNAETCIEIMRVLIRGKTRNKTNAVVQLGLISAS